MPALPLAAITMVAFAANSLLNRLALTETGTDWSSFTAIRIASGAVVLFLLVAARERWITRQMDRTVRGVVPAGSTVSAIALVTYAATFSYAYLTLSTGMGALILFSLVQFTMIGWGLRSGDRPTAIEWTGMVAAFAGFVWLVSPGLSAPDPLGAVLMAAAGIAWGVYTLRGKGAVDPLRLTAGNFLRGIPLAALPLIAVLLFAEASVDGPGLLLGMVSGGITSGLGYALWYRTLRHFSSTQAAILQLTVPVIAAAMGVLFAGEAVTPRLALASTVILGGVALAIVGRDRKAAPGR